MENAAGAINSNVVTLVRNEKSKHLQNLKDDPDNFIGFYGGDFEDIRKGYCAGFTEYFKLKMPEGILNKTDLLDLYSDEGQKYIAMLFGEESNEHSTELPAKKTKFVNNETSERVRQSFKKGVSDGSTSGAEGKYTRISDKAHVDIYVFQALKENLIKFGENYKGTYTTGRTGVITDDLKHNEYVIWNAEANEHFYANADSVKISDTQRVCPGNPQKPVRSRFARSRFAGLDNGEPRSNLFGNEGSPPGSPTANPEKGLFYSPPANPGRGLFDSPDSPNNSGRPVRTLNYPGSPNNFESPPW